MSPEADAPAASEDHAARVSLKNWDVVLGKMVRDLCLAEPHFDNDTAIVFRCGDLVEWATSRYGDRLDDTTPLAPSEYLNIEGARLARFLTGAGWVGAGFVVNCDEQVHHWICHSLIATSSTVIGISVEGDPVQAEESSWAVSVRSHR